MYRFSTEELEDRKLISPAIHYASTARIALSDFKLCPNSHRDKGNVVSSTTFLMFQYNKYMSDLLKRREAVTEASGGSDSALAVNFDNEVMEGIFTASSATVSNNFPNNDK